MSNDDEMDPDLFSEDEDDPRKRLIWGYIDLSVPEGIGVDNPVRMY